MKYLSSILPGLLTLSILICLSCSEGSAPETSTAKPVSQEWKDYWYSGQAELTRYALEQARYGEIHQGDAVLVFVTEDFLEDKQVKYERGEKDKVVSVLKLNQTKRFWTGVYPYSLISSVFTPIDGALPTLKLSTSAQEWCGHSYSQLNFRNNQYQGVLHSYFQGEGDQEFALDKALLEDEIWSQIRLRPEELPTGEIELVPGTQYLRLNHKEFQVAKATASLNTVQDSELSNEALKRYSLDYKDLSRKLAITFEAEFPYTIVGWEEQSGGNRGSEAPLITRAVRTHSIKSPYWGKNHLADSVLRQQLGLDR